MIKGILTAALTSALLLSMESVHSFSPAYRPLQSQNLTNETQDGIYNGNGTSCPHTDTDGNGICDNCGASSGICSKGYVDANGDGICDNCSSPAGVCGGGYVDANGDGICDNYGTQAGNGDGGGYHHGGGNGYGAGSGHGGRHRGGHSR